MTYKRQLFLKHGWGRAACTLLPEIKRMQKVLISKREKGNWAIAVADDELALQFQRLQFMEMRILYAFNIFGLISETVLTPKGWYKSTEEEIAKKNAQSLCSYRLRAHRGRHLRSPWEEDEYEIDEMA